MPDRASPRRTEVTESLRIRTDAADLRLLVSAPDGDRSYPLVGRSRLVVGRGSDCDVVLDDPAVSRRHVAIVVSGIPYVQDLGSRNGTQLFGRTLHKGDRCPLPIGTAFSIGAATIVLQSRASVTSPANEAVVQDPAMRALYDQLDVVGPSPLSVLVLGETGTGKEVFANAVHAASPRAQRTFLAVNCAALSETLLESELFGHERGAFTGAAQAKQGLFEAADGGTVFLDEVGELAATTQAKLLRVLETGEVTPLGSVKARRVDVRFLAATNRDLAGVVESGGFRRDLYYRLNGFVITLPPLRQRPLDILPLAELFARRAAERLERSPPTMDDGARRALTSYAWPGNVRELRNVVERAVSTCRGAPSILAEHLALHGSALPTSPPPAPGDASSVAGSFATTGPLSKERVLSALEATTFNQTEAAKILGVSRRTLINKIILYGIRRPRKGA